MRQSTNRQSMYPQPPAADSYWSSLDSISRSLHSAASSLNSAVATLHHGTYDLPRLSTVVASRRAFEVVSETEVASAQRELASHIEPQVMELIERAEDGLEALKKRERVIRTKVEKRAALQSRAPPPIDHEAREEKLRELRARKTELSLRVAKRDAELDRLTKSLGRP